MVFCFPKEGICTYEHVYNIYTYVYNTYVYTHACTCREHIHNVSSVN